MHDLRKLVGAACLLAPFLTCSNFGPGSALAAEPARSTYIADVTIDGTSLRRLADESDNFHLTWHADDALYGAYGDGWGFVKTSIPKRAIGVSRIVGAPPELKGQDVWEGSGQGGACCWADWNGKSWGMLSTGTDLHMWFTQGRPRALGFTEARLATSSDGGRSWRKADWAFTAADRMLMPSFLQLGRGYHAPELPAAITDYAYSYHSRLMATPGHVQTPGRVDLVRVPKGRIAERAAYQFFAGHGPDGAALWTSDINGRQPILEKPHLLDTPPTVTWNPYLRRFIMVMPHVPAANPNQRGIGFYEAQAPWGPWFAIKTIEAFAGGTAFFFQLPAKWQNPDLSAWLAFSGIDVPGGQEWDALNIVKVRFVLAPPQ